MQVLRVLKLLNRSAVKPGIRWKNVTSYLSEPVKMISLQVVCNGSENAVSIVVLGDSARYLFNCGEGMQRNIQALTKKLGYFGSIFLTSLDWKNVGGIAGFLLSVEQAKIARSQALEELALRCNKQNQYKEDPIKIHGPKGLREYASSLTALTTTKQFPLNWVEIQDEEVVNSKSLKITSVKVIKKPKIEKEVREEDECKNILLGEPCLPVNTIETNDPHSSKRKVSEDVDGKSLSKRRKIDEWSSVKSDSYVLCYVCEITGPLGRLDIKQCMKFGVPFGPLLGQLKTGNDVTLSDGTIVRSTDVCSAQKPNIIFMIIDCPTEEYIESLTNHPLLKEYRSEETIKNKKLAHVYHVTPERVLQNPEYQSWMREFQNDVQHIVLNEKNKKFYSEKQYISHYKLHAIQPILYPAIPIDNDEDNTSQTDQTFFQRAPPGLNVKYVPKLGTSIPPKLKLPEADDVVQNLSSKSIRNYRNRVKPYMENPIDSEGYPHLVFLGTGSACNSIMKNVSGILVRMDEKNSMLFDCGEYILSQIFKFYGEEKAPEILSTIKGIFISHRHADHHSGIVSLIRERGEITRTPVSILGPYTLRTFLEYYSNSLTPISDLYKFYHNKQFALGPTSTVRKVSQLLNLESIATDTVVHCSDAYAVRITVPSGWSVAYSGDTKPCQNMINLAQGVDILIHEATMLDSNSPRNIVKMHSSVSEAISIAKASNAKYTILTHFSQRFAKGIELPSGTPNNICVAHDFMRVNMDSLPLASGFEEILLAVGGNPGQNYDEDDNDLDQEEALAS